MPNSYSNADQECIGSSTKRKLSENPTKDETWHDTPSSSEPPLKRTTRPNKSSKGNAKETPKLPWPVYFESLFKIYKALNTVLAFCSSRKQLAITFPVVRTSVEGLLKQPLELTKVAELKALLPDMIKFAYIPRDQLRINADTHVQESTKGSRARLPDFSAFTNDAHAKSYAHDNAEEDEHVLVLEFLSKGSGKKADNPANTYSLPPALSSQAVKKLIEKRNERYFQAVEELLQATPSSEDPVTLLQSAAREHIPISPAFIKTSSGLDEQRTLTVPDPNDRRSIQDILEELMATDWYKGQVVDRRTYAEKEGQLADLATPLSDAIMQALREARQITTLYTHQVTAIDAIRRGKSLIVSTSTASGKSVVYQVPILNFLEGDRDSTAIYVYPTKALAQDQKGALEQLLYHCQGLQHVTVATFDGDTPKDQRAGIRDNASVIFTNFDMLHASILPHEDNWRKFLKNLKLVAVDELHYYSNLFGSHVAQVMRRLRRLCAAVGNRRVQFVSCSATIASPSQHMKHIFGVNDIEVITEDGAPSGRKEFILWNPPPIDVYDPSLGRRSALSEATALMRFLMKRGVRTILFCKIRKICELAMKTLRVELSADGRLDVLEKVKAYRGGYSHKDRRRIEREAFSGNLLGLVATNALELGVDIGVLDAVIMLGFPSGIASLRQQAGRAGRRARDALSIMVADSLPLDQHYVQNPHELFQKPMDALIVDLNSNVILEAHLQCAAFEMPLAAEDESYFGPLFKKLCDTRLVKDKDGWYHPHPKFLPFPSKHVSIRGIEEEHYTVIDITRLGQPNGVAEILEEIEVSRALFETYEGAVGLTFIVQEVSHDSKVAKLVRADVNWFTRPRDFTNIDAIQTYRIREIKGSPTPAFYGRVDLKTIVFGYFKIRNGVILDVVDLEMPPFERETTGMWIDVPKPVFEILRTKAINAAEAIHAAEHALLNQFAMAADVKTECKVPQKEYMMKESKRKRPARLIFFESAGQDGGIAATAFDHVSELIHDAFEAVESCRCREGCFTCIHSAFCKEGNIVSSKLGAQIIIRGVMGLPIDVDAIPNPEGHLLELPETIVEAEAVNAIDGVEIEPYAA